MTIASPLRYPGGKAAMADLLEKVLRLNGHAGCGLAEPFAGGAGASLTLLFREVVDEIAINDLDKSIYSFWWSLTHRPQQFLDRLQGVRVSMAEWRRQRDIYHHPRKASRLALGFAAFYLNRCNRSGVIMNGGPIGGTDQAGEWTIKARFNKSNLLQRCSAVAEYRERITVSNMDGMQFLKQAASSRMFLFIDPPYFHKGGSLYLNHLDAQYHRSLADCLRSLRHDSWILTYDDCPEIRALYSDWASIRSFSLRYSASDRRKGSEILIAPHGLRLPRSQRSLAIDW